MNTIRKEYHRLLFLSRLKTYLKLLKLPQKPKNNKKVLDFGCASGRDLIKKYKDGYNCYGFDIDKKTVLKTSKFLKKHDIRCKFLCGDGMYTPFKDEIFDEVISNNVLEHIENDEVCISEMYRTLKSEGKLHVIVPDMRNLHTVFHRFLGLKNCFTDKSHLREYEKNEIGEKIEKRGFKIQDLRLTGFFPPFGLKFCHVINGWLPIFDFLNLFNHIIKKHNSQIEIIAIK